MSTYKFSIANYHAIKDATIKLNGITVLAGVNGSGKSTIARWLHHTVKVLNDYDSMVDMDGVRAFLTMIYFMHRFVATLDREKAAQLYSFNELMRNNSSTSFEDTKKYFIQALDIVSSAIRENITDMNNEINMQRYSNYFDVNLAECKDVEEYIQKVRYSLSNDYEDIEQECNQKKFIRSIDDFNKKVISLKGYFEYLLGDAEFDLDFSEDDVKMLKSETFGIPLNLRNVVYINTQFLGQSFSTNDDTELSEMLSSVRCEISDRAKLLVKQLQNIINGDVSLTKKNAETIDISNPSQRFMLVRKNGLSFDLRGAATGEISFSYILQLVKNGWIDNGTMLIIDEPESHLHPQWIVDYARILILIHKHLGTKILISSHNPDMISAIQSIAECYEVLDDTKFYLAEKNEAGTFSFIDQKVCIEKIFETFNIAIDRINNFTRSE
jgi:predicted ATPase